MLYIIIGILIFGFFIATHELGHFTTAKLLGVKVNEYAIGMGPALFQRKKGETLYSLRLFPVGGYCAMEGEDGDSEEPRAFANAALWKKLIILCAGAGVNFLTALVIMAVLYSGADGFYLPVIAGTEPGYGLEECGLQEGDRIISVDGHRTYDIGNVSMFLNRAGEKIDWVVERDGEKIRLNELSMPLQESGTDANGEPVYRRGLNIGTELIPFTPMTWLQQSWFTSIDFVRTVWLSLGDLLSGAFGLRDLSGPVGIIDMMNEVGSNEEISPTPMAAAMNLASLAALIAANLAVMNLLPLPALDGGRIFFLLLNSLLYALCRKKIKAEWEGYVHLIGLVLLLGLSLVVTLSDVGKLFGH